MSQLVTTYWEMLKMRVFKTPTIHIVTIYCANIFFWGGEIVKGDLKVTLIILIILILILILIILILILILIILILILQ